MNVRSDLTFLRFLSLEVVFNALAMGLFACAWLDLRMPLPWWWLLGSTVWVVYTLDHLSDAFLKTTMPLIPRHRFHRKHWLVLLLAICFISVTNLLVLWYFPNRKVFVGGLALSIFVGLYLLAMRYHHWLRKHLPKELMVALIFVIGVWFGPLLYLAQVPQGKDILVMGLFVLLAFVETALMSYFETDLDQKDGHSSFSLAWGKEKARITLISLVLACMLLLGLLLLLSSVQACDAGMVILWLMALLLLVILLLPDFFERKKLYRPAGDLVFMLPALLWFF